MGASAVPQAMLPASPSPAVEPSKAATAATARSWLPALSVVSAGGLVVVAAADSAARFGSGWAEGLFWVGLLVLVVPVAVRLGWSDVGRGERIGLVVLLVAGAYLVKVLYGPAGFVFADEFAHERTVADILLHGRIFEANPLSDVSPLYPGLELVTAALVSITGMSIHAAALLVVGTGRVVLALALFLLVERLAGSARLAGLAAVVYAGNPNFTFWSAQFAYESLSLPLAILVVYLCLAASTSGARRLQVVAFVVGLAIVVTHHLTSYALVAVLAGWWLLAWIRRRGFGARIFGSGTVALGDPGGVGEPGVAMARPDGPPAWLVMGLAGAVLAWLVTYARATYGYLAPVVGGALQDLAGFVAGARAVKTFFQGDPSLVSPAWERAVAVAAVLLVAALLAVGLLRLVADLRANRHRPRPTLGLAFALAALAYFPLLALRALQHGTEISNRAGDFLFLPVGFIVAPVARWLAQRRPAAVGLGALAAVIAIVFVGGVIIGTPRWARLPGSYLVSGDTRALQPESLEAADWLRATFGPGNRVIADESNALVLAGSAGQDVVHGLSWVYFSGGRLSHFELDSLREAGVRFIVVDWRLTTMPPIVGYFFESGEPGAGHHTTGLPVADLLAFERAPELTRVFDSGDIRIYERGATPMAASGSVGPAAPRPPAAVLPAVAG